MKILKTVLVTVWELFVDDGLIALGTLAAVALTAALTVSSMGPTLASGLVLLVGCLTVLAVSVLRAAAIK
jgi:hypothetical protein